jgi:hypothetical protein
LIGVLALNWLSVPMFGGASEPRVQLPFSPYFLQQLQAGQVTRRVYRVVRYVRASAKNRYEEVQRDGWN